MYTLTMRNTTYVLGFKIIFINYHKFGNIGKNKNIFLATFNLFALSPRKTDMSLLIYLQLL